MTDRPIIFSGPMVCALLDGRKTQTRRLATSPLRKCEAGDRLYVRESFALVGYTEIFCGDRSVRTHYMAGKPVLRPEGGVENMDNWPREWSDDPLPEGQRWTPSIHMPRRLSRLTLIVEAVRVEPLQAISEVDAIREGVTLIEEELEDPVEAYRRLWDSLHGEGSWESNPDVVALTFRVERGNIDRIAA